MRMVWLALALIFITTWSGATMQHSEARPLAVAGKTVAPGPVELQAAVQSGDVSMRLIGDGKNTSTCELVLTNSTAEPLKVRIPKYQAFLPENAKYQVMMCTIGRIVDLPPGSPYSVKIPTVCSSAKTVKPPPASGCVYTAGSHPDQQIYTATIKILETCNSSHMSKMYEKIPVSRERRLQTIAQLSIWKECGLKTGDPADLITSAQIKDELLTATGLPESSLNSKQKEQLNSFADSLFAAVDLTCKRAKVDGPVIAETPSKSPGPANEAPPAANTGQSATASVPAEAAEGTKTRLNQPATTAARNLALATNETTPGCCTQTRPPCPCYVELIWRPMTGFMNFAGDIAYLNTDKQLYHSALRIQMPDPDGSCHHYVIELTDYLDGAAARAVGQVDSIDVYNVMNAGVRLNRDGQPNKADECWPPIRLSTDCAQVRRIRDMVARLQFPKLDYGDNVGGSNGKTDDWMCNSLTSFLLKRAGIDTDDPRIRPLNGLTPGWDAGNTLADSTGRLPGR